MTRAPLVLFSRCALHIVKIMYMMKKLLIYNIFYHMIKYFSMQTFSPNKFAVGYCRVSTDIQVQEGHSIEAQKNTIMDYCIKNKLQFNKFYVDEGKSGKDMQRPKLQKMLDRLVPGTVVISTAISRISRSVKDLQTIIDIIKNKASTLILLDINIDTGTAMGDLMMNITSSFSQFERKQTSERVSVVLNNMSHEGKLITKPRFGYKLIKDGDRSSLVENDEEQQVLNKIRHLIKADPKITTANIIRSLESDGVKIRKSKKIYHSSIMKIIKDNHLRPVV